jgi:hypothetical protein
VQLEGIKRHGDLSFVVQPRALETTVAVNRLTPSSHNDQQQRRRRLLVDLSPRTPPPSNSTTSSDLMRSPKRRKGVPQRAPLGAWHCNYQWAGAPVDPWQSPRYNRSSLTRLVDTVLVIKELHESTNEECSCCCCCCWILYQIFMAYTTQCRRHALPEQLWIWSYLYTEISSSIPKSTCTLLMCWNVSTCSSTTRYWTYLFHLIIIWFQNQDHVQHHNSYPNFAAT